MPANLKGKLARLPDERVGTIADVEQHSEHGVTMLEVSPVGDDDAPPVVVSRRRVDVEGDDDPGEQREEVPA